MCFKKQNRTKKIQFKITWLPPVLESPGKSLNLKRDLEMPGILMKLWKSAGFFSWSNSPKERFLSKHHHFLGFLCMLNLAVH